MEYAVVASGGKQYKVTPGQVLDIEKTHTDGTALVFDKVLLHVSDKGAKIGTPYITGFEVKAKVLGAKRGEKVLASKFKAKAKYRKSVGFRHELLSIEILPFLDGKKQPSKS